MDSENESDESSETSGDSSVVNEQSNSPPPEQSQEQPIASSQPQPYDAGRNHRAQVQGISKNFGQEIWNQLAKTPYIKRILGERINSRENRSRQPELVIENNGKILKINYRLGRFNCEVKVELQGISSAGEAQHIWEKIIRPVLIEGTGQ